MAQCWRAGAGMAQWWEHSPPTNVTRDSIPGLSVMHMGLLFVVSSLLCFERLFSSFSGFPLWPTLQGPGMLQNARTCNTWASGSGDMGRPFLTLSSLSKLFLIMNHSTTRQIVWYKKIYLFEWCQPFSLFNKSSLQLSRENLTHCAMVAPTSKRKKNTN